PRGPHHFANSSGTVHALNTVKAGACKTRFNLSPSSSGCTVTTRLLMDAVAHISEPARVAPSQPLRADEAGYAHQNDESRGTLPAGLRQRSRARLQAARTGLPDRRMSGAGPAR